MERQTLSLSLSIYIYISAEYHYQRGKEGIQRTRHQAPGEQDDPVTCLPRAAADVATNPRALRGREINSTVAFSSSISLSMHLFIYH